ncbi:DUF1206 domain-containing protein [Mycolicibacterium vanbaalenii]|uniref:DUF1206 domain-containing protein n=1 Tax=Mycolicibacterium vanbaalenii (strain DSM 7251 / JCM 13017 / BCRC 16820 / KCTC 9966 / NRRL B-24157 / PYR-1) TaxID=350058 RepID=A1T765_MYCVP|nr:DUF1206 domain-containing protein [Mycolicibacterium vanbaalenii]ABM13015.1 protein of unknown function DUF1206 [Mycolicibacterium vanbaalenii PYR-1]MCV7127968.1 DUF1206 domain-containing protein [Mycolicibacterium vanbaalenii PYR-1]
MATRPSAASLHRSAHGAADRATDSDAFEYLARAGFAASGVLHLLVGFIIAQLAFVGGSGNADQSGALATLASQTGGTIILWAAAAGLVALGLWRIAEAVIGGKPGESSGRRGDNPAWKRGKALALAVVNFAIAFSAARYAMGSGQSSAQQNAGLSAQLMQSGWGKALLIAVGVGVAAVGAYHVYKGVSEKFLDDLKVSGGTAVTAVGVTGYVAKGLVLAGAGLLVVIATLQADPSKATGLDAAVKTLGQAPFGKVALIAAAAGIAAFGAYSFVRSRYGRM